MGLPISLSHLADVWYRIALFCYPVAASFSSNATLTENHHVPTRYASMDGTLNLDAGGLAEGVQRKQSGTLSA